MAACRSAALMVFLAFLLLSTAFPQAYAQIRKETQLTLSPETFTVVSGQSITLTARLTSDGKPIAGRQIVFSASLGSVNPSVAVTDDGGFASTVYTAPELSVKTSVTVIASFQGDPVYKGSTAISSGVVEASLQKISVRGASFPVPETLKDDVSSYRSSIPEDVLKILPVAIPSESFILATSEDLYLVFASRSDKGMASVDGWRIPKSIKLNGINVTVIVADSVTFEKEGSPATIRDILANPDSYRFKLVKISANRRQISILYDPDEPPYMEFPITFGYLAEKPVKPLEVLGTILGRAKDFSLKIDEKLVRSLLEIGDEERLWLFNFEYEYWYDAFTVTNGIVIPADHPIFKLIDQSMPVVGRFACLEGKVVLYDVKTDIPYESVSSISKLKENREKYIGRIVGFTARCYGGYVSVQEVIEHNTPCGEDYVYVEDVGCVNVVFDVRLDSLAAWSEVSIPPRSEEILLSAGASSLHQDKPFVNDTGVFEIIGKVVSAKQISSSLPDDVALIIFRARKIGEIDFEALAQKVRDDVKKRVGELLWVMQDIYPYGKKPNIPFKVPGKVFMPKAPIFVDTPRDIPEICVGRNFTLNIASAMPEERITLNITNSYISSISITLKEAARNITIFFGKMWKPLKISEPPALVYAYHEISINISGEALRGANITFWISKEWLTTNNVTAENVVMLRYYMGKWIELPTRAVGINATHLKFVSETSGFSIFAIVARKAAVKTFVEGYVRDDGKPIRDVKVIALSRAVGKISETETDEMGHYFIELPAGEYILVYSAPGYADRSADVLLRVGEAGRMDVSLRRAKEEFSKDWGGVRFEVSLITEEPWRIGGEAEAEIWITVSEMGGNRRVEFRQLKLWLLDTSVEKIIPLNVKTEIGGTVYSGNVSLRILDGFKIMKPDSSESYKLELSLEGSFTDRWGTSWPGLAIESTSVKVYAPPSQVSLSAELPAKVVVGEDFDVRVRMKNGGEYPIGKVKVELLPPFGTSAVGPLDWSMNSINPGEEDVATFKLKADLVTTTTIYVSLSYEMLWGYTISEPAKALGSVTITKIPTRITISTTQTRVAVGEKIVVKGSIQPALSVPLTLTIMEPDGVTRTSYGTSASNGTFGFEVVLDKKGKYSFMASFGGDLIHEESKSNEVYVEAEEKRACIIATTAYGSELDSHVQFLREFRDCFVLKTFAGRNFMDVFNAWYYSFSPMVASTISTSEELKTAARVALYPLIGILRFGVLVSNIFSFNSEVSVIMAGIAISALIGLTYFTPPIALILNLAGRIPRLRPKALLPPWVISMVLVILAETIPSQKLMMIGSASLVISTIALTAWTATLKAVNLLSGKQ